MIDEPDDLTLDEIVETWARFAPGNPAVGTAYADALAAAPRHIAFLLRRIMKLEGELAGKR